MVSLVRNAATDNDDIAGWRGILVVGIAAMTEGRAPTTACDIGRVGIAAAHG